MIHVPRRLRAFLLAPVILVVGGTAGYWLLEPEYSLFDALYMTVITITTVGYGETHPLHPAGRWFTIFLLFGGVFTLFSSATEIVRAVVTGELQDLYGRRIMSRNLAALTNHLIVCGYGRMGKFVCREFSQQGLPFVLIDRKAEALAGFDLPHGIALVGDATSDEVLLREANRSPRVLLRRALRRQSRQKARARSG